MLNDVQTVTEKIKQRRYQMLVHSYLYYQLGDTVIDDYTFDRWAKELVQLQERYPNESKEADYYEEFKDFDGSSGFDLPYNMPNIQITSRLLLKNRGNYDDHGLGE